MKVIQTIQREFSINISQYNIPPISQINLNPIKPGWFLASWSDQGITSFHLQTVLPTCVGNRQIIPISNQTINTKITPEFLFCGGMHTAPHFTIYTAIYSRKLDVIYCAKMQPKFPAMLYWLIQTDSKNINVLELWELCCCGTLEYVFFTWGIHH